jgi:hypothetical protein
MKSKWTSCSNSFIRSHLPCFFNDGICVAGFEVLTVVVVKGSIFWNITPCRPLQVNGRSEGIYSLHLQDRRISQACCADYVCYLFYSGFLLGLLFDREGGGRIFPLNVSWLSTGYMALYPRRSFHFSSVFIYVVSQWPRTNYKAARAKEKLKSKTRNKSTRVIQKITFC